MRGSWLRNVAGAIACASLGAGCAQLDTTQITPFRLGVVSAREQAALSFAAANEVVREVQVESADRLAALDEESFGVALRAQDLARWSEAFSILETYAGLLQQLTAPERRGEVEKEIAELGANLQRRTAGELPPGLAAGAQRLGGLLVERLASASAAEAAAQADPGVQQLLRSAADAIGATSDAGVRGQVRTAWIPRLAGVESAFLDAHEARRAEQKRQLARSYAAMLDARDLQDAGLTSLRASLLTLADAHTALAAGDRATAGELVRLVRREYEGFRAALAQAAAATPPREEPR